MRRVNFRRNQIIRNHFAYTKTMFETTVSVPLENEHILDFVRSGVDEFVIEADGMSSDSSSAFRKYFSVACSDTFRFQLKRCLANAVSEALALAYKNTYIRNLLKVDGSDFCQNVLVNVICIFDSSADMKTVANFLNLDKPLFLDGYYNFRMRRLKQKWQELSKLVGNNRYILEDESLIVEFLQYLSESIPRKAQVLSICFEEDDYFLCDQNNKVLPITKSFAKNVTAEEEALVNAVCIRPQSVRVYCKQMPSRPFCDMIKDLYPTDFVVVP